MKLASTPVIPARCDQCAALCCQLKVVLGEGDKVPAHLIDASPGAPAMMRRNAAGFCVALDPVSHRCTIYADRPSTCRRFVMDGGYCRSVRAEHYAQSERDRPLSVQ